MIISPKHKLMYFKTRKTAGTSTEVAIRKCMKASAGGFDPEAMCTRIMDGERKKTKMIHTELNNVNNYKMHQGPRTSVLADMTMAEHKSYFKFMGVRNPYDRLVSCYYFRVKTDRSIITKDTTFKEFIKYIAPRPVGIVNLEPMYPWAIRCDDFIRYENFEADLVRILGKWFDTTDMEIPQNKTTHRPSPKKHYREYYDTECYDLISKKYDKDLAYFEYEF